MVDTIIDVLYIGVLVFFTYKYAKRGFASSLLYIIGMIISFVSAPPIASFIGGKFGYIFEGKTGALAPNVVLSAIVIVPVIVLLLFLTKLLATALSKAIKPIPVFGLADRIIGGLLGLVIGYFAGQIIHKLGELIVQIMNIS